MQKALFAFLLVFFCEESGAQVLPYTNPVYQIRKDSAVDFGSDFNYCGRSYPLKMNIYKPIGDGNIQRPVIVFVHGGAFTSGEDFNEYNMNLLAMEFAKRGYVAASINYREGHHLYPYGIGSPAPINLGVFLDWTVNARLFVSDSGEVIRSIYRAQQDTKAAIRKMKERHLTDSSSTCRFFLGGHSAGAITVMAASFMDQVAEKSPLCAANTTLPNPHWISGGFNLFGSWVVTQVNGPQDKDNTAYAAHNPPPFDFDAASCYTRPDLGSIDGTQNIAAGYDTKIMGVASLAGAVVDTNVFSGPRTPAIFMYHIANDMVVPFNYGRPFNYLSDLLSPAPNGRWPLFYGSYWMEQKLKAINYPAPHHVQVFNNNGDITNSHDILPNHAVVADSIAQFFARVMDTSTACNNIILAVGNRFTAARQGRTALLKWEDENSAAVSRYSIERSVDGTRFTEIAELTNPTGNSFTYIDQQPASGINFYRIKEWLHSGQVSYSETRQVNFDKTGGISLYPNPAKDQLNIRFDEKLQGSIRLYDMQGRTVYRRETAFINPGTVISIPLESFESGQYNLQFVGAGSVISKPVVIVK